MKQAQKIFALEVWSDTAAEGMQRISRAAAPADAPKGVYRCNIPGADGAKVALYGITPGILSNEGERAAAFDYLKSQAADHLKPQIVSQ
jgi:hypothetical protein